MQTIASMLIALAIMTAPLQAAEETLQKHRHLKQRPAHQLSKRTAQPEVVKQQEYLADKRPIGSASWWDQMLRENRAGTCCN